MIWLLVIGAIFAAIFGYEFYFPLIYRIKARRAGCGTVPIKLHRPLGIPYIRNAIKWVGEGTILKRFSGEPEMIARTYMSQRLFNFPIVTVEPENVKTVLSTKFSDFSLGLRFKQMAPAFGEGIFTLDGSGWHHSRTLLRPQFTREQISQLLSINDHCDSLIKVIESRQSQQKFVDIDELLHELTMDTATEFLFGESIDSLQGTSSQLHPGQTVTAKQFVESQVFVLNYVLSRLYLSSLYFLNNSKEFQEHVKRCRSFISFFVDKALAQVAEGKKPERYTFSYGLAESTNESAIIRDQLFNILIAGRDTTAGTLSYLLYYLAKNPAVFKKLQDEVRTNFSGDVRAITFEQLRGSRYMNHVIDETLRLAPQVPLNFRTAVRDTILPVGGGKDGKEPVFVPKDSEVSYQCYTMHRDKAVFGADADDFKPERWDTLKNLHPWQYIPFNGGPRICIGQQFAKTEIALVVVRLLLEYDRIELPANSPADPPYRAALTLHTGPMEMRFVKE